MEITLTTTNLPREVVVHKNLDEFLKKMAMNKIKSRDDCIAFV